MSNRLHPPQTSSLQRGATSTPHTQGIHHGQLGEGQWMNPVYMVSIMRKWNVVLGCGYTLTSVTHLCFVKHISSMFHQHLQYREVVTPCSIHHWCHRLKDRTIKWYSHSDTGIHMLPPPIPTLTIHSPSTSHHIVHYHIGVFDRVWGGSKAPVCH